MLKESNFQGDESSLKNVVSHTEAVDVFISKKSLLDSTRLKQAAIRLTKMNNPAPGQQASF